MAIHCAFSEKKRLVFGAFFAWKHEFSDYTNRKYQAVVVYLQADGKKSKADPPIGFTKLRFCYSSYFT